MNLPIRHWRLRIGWCIREIAEDSYFFPFYFILETITSYHSAQHSVIHLTIYESLEEHMLNGVCSIKLQYDQVHKSFFSSRPRDYYKLSLCVTFDNLRKP